MGGTRRDGCSDGSPRFIPPTVIGIDDWAWRCNQRYGTIICDLERRKTIVLLPDREPATAQTWLSDQPQIEVVARDRGGGYALAASKALPKAIQVADRWHLMENASRAFLDVVRKSMRQIRAALSGRRRSIPIFSQPRSGSNMRDMSAGKRPMP
jgi:transposase